METVSIRDVDSETWSAIRAEALKHKMKVGRFLKVMVQEYKARDEDNWNKIMRRKRLGGDAIFWNEVEAAAQEMRKGFSFQELP